MARIFRLKKTLKSPPEFGSNITLKKVDKNIKYSMKKIKDCEDFWISLESEDFKAFNFNIDVDFKSIDVDGEWIEVVDEDFKGVNVNEDLNVSEDEDLKSINKKKKK
jgi:hypothetical protein